MPRETKSRSQNGHIPLGVGLYLHSQAARMTQTTSRKLSYWAETQLVTPQVHRRNGGPSIFSYTDLLAIRTLERLRNSGLPLQRMRKAVRYFYDFLGRKSEWWNLKMVVDNRDLLTIIPRDQSPSGREEAVIASRGGQKVLEVIFADLVNDLLAGGKLERFPEVKEYVTIDAKIQGGAPVIKNTRIKTTVLYMWHQYGLTTKQIADMYDGMDEESVTAAIEYEQALAKSNHNAHPPLRR